MISKEEEEWERKDKMLARRGMTTATEVMLENDIDELRVTVKTLRAENAKLEEVLRQVSELVGEDCDCDDYGPCVACTIKKGQK